MNLVHRDSFLKVSLYSKIFNREPRPVSALSNTPRMASETYLINHEFMSLDSIYVHKSHKTLMGDEHIQLFGSYTLAQCHT